MSASVLAICLGLFSAVTVALANYGTKRGGDVLTARMVLSVSAALIVLPLVPFVDAPPRALWPNMLLAITVHWGYQFSLVRALHRGDLSLVFPVMRGSSPMLVAIGGAVFLQEHLSPLAWLGVGIATLAVISFALPERRKGLTVPSNKAALFWAGMTAIAIGAYSLVDAATIRQMPSPFTFILYLFLLDWIGITFVTLFLRRGRIWAHVKPQLAAGGLAGFASVLSFGAALYAFTLTDAALVTALRETSVVWAALMGAVWLGEGFGRRRIAASACLAAGLILMQAF